MDTQVHTVSVYSDTMHSVSETHLSGDYVFLHDQDAHAIIELSNLGEVECGIEKGRLHPRSSELSATLKHPYRMSLGELTHYGTYELELYVPTFDIHPSVQRGSPGVVYLPTPDPLFPDYRGRIAHAPTGSVYEKSNVKEQSDPLLVTQKRDLEKEMALRNIETGVTGVIARGEFEYLADAGDLIDVVPVS